MLNKSSKPGRPFTWNEQEVLGALMRVFRRKGFAHVSVRDLESETKLHPGSLYKAYGSKEGLFLAAFREYNQRVVEGRVRRYLDEAADPIDGIRALFSSTFEGAEAKGPGCLLTNTAVESHSLEPSVRAEVTRGLTILERGFARALERAEVPDAEAHTARLLALYQGVLVLVRYGAPRSKLLTITEGAVAPFQRRKGTR